jgi:serine/threonine protein kinase
MAMYPLDPNHQYKQIKMGQRIGSGAFGQVFNGHYGDQPCAIKEMSLSDDPEKFQNELRSAREEMQILWELRHPNVLLFYGASFVRREQRELLCLVTELCLGSCEIYTGSAAKLKDGLAKGELMAPSTTSDPDPYNY